MRVSSWISHTCNSTHQYYAVISVSCAVSTRKGKIKSGVRKLQRYACTVEPVGNFDHQVAFFFFRGKAVDAAGARVAVYVQGQRFNFAGAVHDEPGDFDPRGGSQFNIQ